MASIGFNPFVTSVAQGMFNTKSEGLRQGTAYADPATRFRLRGCLLNSNEALPMWGGVGVYLNVPGVAGAPDPSLGEICGRATGATGSKALAGFSTYDQAYGMVTSPQSQAPLAGANSQVMVYPLGSLARLAVACDPALIDLQGDPIGSQVSWDYVNQRLIPFLGTLTISSGTYNNTTGIVALTMSAAITFDSGDAIIVSGLTGTGTNLADLNGTWTAIEPTGGTTVTFQAPAGLGATTITGGSLTLGSGASVALPVKVLEVQESNCMVVEYDATNNVANWNYDGAAAVIQL